MPLEVAHEDIIYFMQCCAETHDQKSNHTVASDKPKLRNTLIQLVRIVSEHHERQRRMMCAPGRETKLRSEEVEKSVIWMEPQEGVGCRWGEWRAWKRGGCWSHRHCEHHSD